MTKVIHVKGASDNICKCGNWLKHWENFSGEKAVYCAEKNCLFMDLSGTVVQKNNSTDQRLYIIPLCKEHNSDYKVLEVNGILVSAYLSETCEKR